MRGVWLIVVVLVAGCGKKDSVGAQSEVMPEPELIVSAEQLYLDFSDGEPNAVNAKYLGKIIKVRGRFEASEPNGDGFLIGFETGSTSISGTGSKKAALVGVVSASAKDAVSKLKSGDDIVVIEKCAGKESDDARKGSIKITLTSTRIDAHYPR